MYLLLIVAAICVYVVFRTSRNKGFNKLLDYVLSIAVAVFITGVLSIAYFMFQPLQFVEEYKIKDVVLLQDYTLTYRNAETDEFMSLDQVDYDVHSDARYGVASVTFYNDDSKVTIYEKKRSKFFFNMNRPYVFINIKYATLKSAE